MSRVHNFNAGPAALPLPALERAQRELLDFEGTGMSILEHSHRGKAYESVHNEALSLLRELLDIPSSHDVFFMQGGASAQFALVPMNLLPEGKSADYLVTGGWAEKALEEAKRVGIARAAANTSENKRFTRIPTQAELKLDAGAAYVHMTSNNTLFGTQWHAWPKTGNVPLVCDMSSDFLWKKFDVKDFSLVYAGAQKNIGPSGIVVLIAEKNVIASGRKDIPIIFQYRTHADNNSLYHTPPTFSIYLVRNVLAHLKSIGGLDKIEAINRKKGDTLYAALDELAGFYRAPVERASRSYMNVVFNLPTEELEKKFVAEAARKQMVGLSGHRSTGGIRVSLYNAVSVESVECLVEFMRTFAKSA